ARVLQMSAKLCSEKIASQLRNHANGIAKAGKRNRLVCALAAGVNLKVEACNRLSFYRNARGLRNKINIDASYHHNRLTSQHEIPCEERLSQNTGARATRLRPDRNRTNIQIRKVFAREEAEANSRHTKTPHAAEIMVAPCPME